MDWTNWLAVIGAIAVLAAGAVTAIWGFFRIDKYLTKRDIRRRAWKG